MLEIVNSITGELLQVAQDDFENQMDWHQAKQTCEELGSGWRLPTKSELELMHSNLFQKGKGSFKSDNYWSSTETSSFRAWVLHFGDGTEDYGFHKNKKAFVRPVMAF
jgi:hypothetical protein